jgi:hypothetical protein
MRYAAYGELGLGFWIDVLVVFASTIIYLAIGFWLFGIVERKVRRDATLVEY